MALALKTCLVADAAAGVKQRRVQGFVHAKILMAGWTQQRIARRLQISRGHVCNLVAGRHRPPRLQKRIALLIGLSPQELWGEFCAKELKRAS